MAPQSDSDDGGAAGGEDSSSSGSDDSSSESDDDSAKKKKAGKRKREASDEEDGGDSDEDKKGKKKGDKPKKSGDKPKKKAYVCCAAVMHLFAPGSDLTSYVLVWVGLYSSAPRAKSAYMFFTDAERIKIKSEPANKDKSFTEIGKILGERWAKLSDAEKKPFEAMSDKDKERYNLLQSYPSAIELR